MKKFLNNLSKLNLGKIALISVLFATLNLIIILIAHLTIPYLGFFPYKEVFSNFHLPYYLNSLANFDGVQYVIIAREGYHTYNQAFFPLFPILIRNLALLLSQNYLLSGILLSNLIFIPGLYYLYKYLLESEAVKNNASTIILFLLLFPTSFFFQAVYTESLFLFLSVGYLYFFKKEKLLFSFILGALTSLTRLSGIFLILPAIGIFIDQYRKERSPKAMLTLAAPVVGVIAYSIYLFITTRDPLFFYTSQPAFGANRSTHLITLPQVLYRYLKIFTTSDFNFQYFISIVEFSIFILVFGTLIFHLYKLIRVSKKNFELIGLCLFSLAIIVLPTLTGTLSSVPRYSLLAISFFIAIAGIKNKKIELAMCLLFIIMHVVLLGFFSQGYFVS